jgi:radical SAM protein with 4Fe4S-binding SPASM domain
MAIKDMATHDATPADAAVALAKTRALFAEWGPRVTVVPVRFHNALRQSAVNLGNEHPEQSRGYSLCHQPWVNLTVDFAGRVVACCRDLRSEYVLGNLLETPAAEIWNGERMTALRRALAERRPDAIGVCANCDVPWSGSYAGRTPTQRILGFFTNALWAR